MNNKPVTSSSTAGGGVAPLLLFVVPFAVIGSLAGTVVVVIS